MATLTPNYNLSKPEVTDPFGDFRESYNDNMDIIDANMGGGGGGDVMDVEVNGTSVVDPVSKVAEITMPTKVSDLLNDTGFITSTVANLTNYYTKSETYTQNEVDALVSAIVTLNLLVVQTLPVSDISQTTIYLVPKQTAGTQDVYDEYINLDGTSSGWEHIGSTEIDLSNYYTKSEVNTLLAGKANTADIPTVNDGTLTIQQNGTTVGTFSANQSGNTTINLAGGGSSYSAGDGIDITNDEISVDTTFTEASTRTNISSGDTLSTIWGKIKKFFSDLKTVAFTGSYTDLTDQPTIPDISTKVSKTGDTMSGSLGFSGGNIDLRTPNSSSDNSGDIAFFYGNGQEKSRIWTANDYTTPIGPQYRVYKKDGTLLYSGRLATVRELFHPFDIFTFSGTNTRKRVSFSGQAHTRTVNMFLVMASQNAIGNIIPISFGGASGYNTITGVYIPNDMTTTDLYTTGTSLMLPRFSGDWGIHTLIKVYPDDEITVTVYDVN